MAIGKVNISANDSIKIKFNNYISENEINGNSGLVRTIVSPLPEIRRYLSATSVGNYALFGGGSNNFTNVVSTVDGYNNLLIRSAVTSLSLSRKWLSAITIGNYALFGGGNTDLSPTNVVDAYDTSLTRTTPTPLSVARRLLGAARVGNYALFGGGYGSAISNVVDAYDTSLVRTTPTPLSVARNTVTATSIDGYALFGGGSNKSVVDAYDTSLTRTTPTPLSVARNAISATPIGNYALFGGGSPATNVVDAYDTSLTRTTPTPLSVARYGLAAVSIIDYGIFAGGNINEDDDNNIVDIYDISLVRSIPVPLSLNTYSHAAASIGNYAIFAGGYNNNTGESMANAYSSEQLNLMRLELPIGIKYKFSEHAEEQVTTHHSILVNSPATGYIKYKSGTIKNIPTFGRVWNEINIDLETTTNCHIATNDIIWVLATFGNKGIYYSTDGMNWEQSNITAGQFYGVSYLNNIWIANGSNTVLYSTDGMEWTQSNITSGSIMSTAYANNIWLVGGHAGMYYSTDGMTWIKNNTVNESISNFIYKDGNWITYGNSGAYYSTDGINWQQSDLSELNIPSEYYIRNLDDKLLSIDNHELEIAYYSTDGINWSNSQPILYNIAYANNMWIGIGVEAGYDPYDPDINYGNGLYYSTNGINWIQSNISEDIMYRILYANNMWVAIGNNIIYYSTNGIIWNNHEISISSDWVVVNVDYHNRWVMIVLNDNQNATRIYNSIDGINWTLIDTIEGFYDDLTYINNTWIIYGSIGIISSTDGINWAQSNITWSDTWMQHQVYSNNKLLILLYQGGIGRFYSLITE